MGFGEIVRSKFRASTQRPLRRRRALAFGVAFATLVGGLTLGMPIAANAWACTTVPGSTLTYVNPFVGSANETQDFSCTRPHSGLDFAKPGYDHFNVVAIKAGTVVDRGTESSCHGKYLVVTHTDGVEDAEAHLDTLNYTVNQSVLQGDIEATTGNTGDCAMGYHMHISTARNWDTPASDPWNSTSTTLFDPYAFLTAHGASL
ncbi:M23 family metallopeptidase [Galbitalea sp. SE-J8]|uniref:M23 family metallopeptidase n=1 Tax=Galbitalea sp. SE-J8 TaxID=3054952 RepID=UPI00259CA010|nr:M23 family metallopeptidase [Galbitalea sp. SE-J8]MDM4763759.1 M23 family metallopeptidase [Galbitalea sp. SE-J8]